jgi:hypothetical protein
MATKKVSLNEFRQIVKKIIKEENESNKELSYYVYETPKISIMWNGKTQPMGRFKSALEALDVIKKVMSAGSGVPNNNWQLQTPDGVIDISKDLY